MQRLAAYLLSSAMRVLFIQNVAPGDPRAFGGQRIHHELTRAMAELGHDARALFLTPDGGLPSLPYRGWAIRETGRLRFDTRAVARALPAVFGEWTPDVLYAGAGEAAAACEWAQGRCAVVATSHHYDPPDLTSGPSFLRPLAWLRELRRLQRFRLERRMLRAADLVLATSEFGAQALKARGYLDPTDEAPVLLNGVADEWFAPEAPVAMGSPPGRGFLFVGRMDAQKGVDVLIAAQAGREGSWPITLAGDGWMEDEYRRLARDAGLDSVHFLGAVDHAGLRDMAPAFDAFVLPSRAENCPLVLLEAMAAGLAVVSTNVGGIPELVSDGESALLVAPEDPTALGRAMDRVEADAELRHGLTRAGRGVAEEQRWTRVASRLEQHLERLATPTANPVA